MTGLYVKGKSNIGKSNVDLVTGEVVAILVDLSIYSPDLSLDEFKSDIPNSAVIAERTLTGKSFDNAIFDADDITYPSLVADKSVSGIVIALNTDLYSTSPLLFINDGSLEPVNPFPIVTDGTDFTVTWPNDINRIFKL